MSVFLQTAKATLYQPDGKGRDSYIYYNNGGLSSPNKRIINLAVVTH